MNKPFHIAIDGPCAAGKGTVSRLVAEKLGFLYVDTGAMYRMSAYLAIHNGLDPQKEEVVLPLIKNSKMEMRNPTDDEKDGRLITVFLNGDDVSWKIRTEEVGQGASKIAVLKKVRRELVKKQQEIASNQNVIMEGRDITSVVLPDADLKIYLTANESERAKRRQLQLQTKGENVSYKEVLADLSERDFRDSNRQADPLKIVDDAWVLDTSGISINGVVQMIIERTKTLQAKK